jgi:hypothetical protein
MINVGEKSIVLFCLQSIIFERLKQADRWRLLRSVVGSHLNSQQRQIASVDDGAS